MIQIIPSDAFVYSRWQIRLVAEDQAVGIRRVASMIDFLPAVRNYYYQ
jgi:hypothetical protein